MPTTFDFADLTLREKASVSYEDLKERFLRFEMMKEGVSKPITPDYLPIPDRPAFEATTGYELQISGSSTMILFKDPKALEGFMALQPGKVEENWYLRHYQEMEIRGVNKAGEFSLKPVQVVDTLTFKNLTNWEAECRKAKEANDKMEKEFTSSNEDLVLILDRLTNAWRQATRTVAKYQDILATRDEYVRMAGTEEVALAFLQKTYTKAEIAEALAFAQDPQMDGPGSPRYNPDAPDEPEPVSTPNGEEVQF
jgi:hypothetical protein